MQSPGDSPSSLLWLMSKMQVRGRGWADRRSGEQGPAVSAPLWGGWPTFYRKTQ